MEQEAPAELQVDEGPFPGRLWPILGPSSIPRRHLSTMESVPASGDPGTVSEGAGSGARVSSHTCPRKIGGRAEPEEILRLGVPQALGDRSRIYVMMCLVV